MLECSRNTFKLQSRNDIKGKQNNPHRTIIFYIPYLPFLTLSLPSHSVQIKHKSCQNTSSVETRQKTIIRKSCCSVIERFHLSGHSFRFRWTVQGQIRLWRISFSFWSSNTVASFFSDNPMLSLNFKSSH